MGIPTFVDLSASRATNQRTPKINIELDRRYEAPTISGAGQVDKYLDRQDNALECKRDDAGRYAA